MRECDASDSGTRKPPRYLLVGLTNLCTTRCSFCYRRDLHLEPQYFPFDRYKTILDELGPHLDTLEFSGIGEPLLHERFKTFSSYARDRYPASDLSLGLVSNGSLLTRDISDFLVEQNFSYLWFSMNAATPETHMKIMPGLDFDKIIRSIGELIQIRNKFGTRLPAVRLSFLVTKENYFEALDFIDLALQIGADMATIGSIDTVLNPRLRQEQYVSEREFGPVLEEIEARASEDKRISCVPRWVFWPEVYEQPGQENAVAINCGNTGEVFGIYFSSGEVTFCCYMAAEIENKAYCLGNICESSGLEIWNGPRALAFVRSMRNLETTPSICKWCLNFWNKEWAQPCRYQSMNAYSRPT